MAITGMALGVDTVFGQAVLDLRDNKNYDIGLLCAVPCFHYQEKWFNKTDIENFENLLKKANRVVYVTEDEYRIEGVTNIEEVEEILGIKIEGDFETLNGFLTYMNGKIPAENSTFLVKAYGYKFQVIDVQNKVIQDVKVTKLDNETDK